MHYSNIFLASPRLGNIGKVSYKIVVEYFELKQVCIFKWVCAIKVTQVKITVRTDRSLCFAQTALV